MFDRLLNVLFVEDSVADTEIGVLSLEASGLKVLVRRVETESDYLLALRDPTDIVLSDHSMPAFDAKRALKLLREQGGDIPFIVVSGRIGESAAVDMMKAGANDYVRKDNLERLAPAVRRELGEAENRRRARFTADKLQQQEQTLDNLMHNLPGMVYRLRRAGTAWHFDFASDGCKDLTGHANDEIDTGLVRPAHLLLEHGANRLVRLRIGGIVDVGVADVAGEESAGVPRHFPGDLERGTVHRLEILLAADDAQLLAVGVVGKGLHHVGARMDEFADRKSVV